MKTINVGIEGVSPYLMCRFSDASSQEKKTRKVEVNDADPRSKALEVAYVNPDDGTFYFSSASITGSMANAGKNHKVKGTRGSLRFVVPGAVRPLEPGITILDLNGKPATTFEVDARPVTIPATKGRIMRYRPRFDKWAAKFDLVVNDDLISPSMVHQLMNEAGVSVGIGDFRPSKAGPFGTFRVIHFEELRG